MFLQVSNECNVIKTIINHLPVITLFIGGINLPFQVGSLLLF